MPLVSRNPQRKELLRRSPQLTKKSVESMIRSMSSRKFSGRLHVQEMNIDLPLHAFHFSKRVHGLSQDVISLFRVIGEANTKVRSSLQSICIIYAHNLFLC
jgi:hypothetical protein